MTPFPSSLINEALASETRLVCGFASPETTQEETWVEDPFRGIYFWPTPLRHCPLPLWCGHFSYFLQWVCSLRGIWIWVDPYQIRPCPYLVPLRERFDRNGWYAESYSVCLRSVNRQVIQVTVECFSRCLCCSLRKVLCLAGVNFSLFVQCPLQQALLLTYRSLSRMPHQCKDGLEL